MFVKRPRNRDESPKAIIIFMESEGLTAALQSRAVTSLEKQVYATQVLAHKGFVDYNLYVRCWGCICLRKHAFARVSLWSLCTQAYCGRLASMLPTRAQVFVHKEPKVSRCGRWPRRSWCSCGAKQCDDDSTANTHWQRVWLHDGVSNGAHSLCSGVFTNV